MGALTSTHYRKSPLVQRGMKLPCQVTVEMSPTLKNGQLLDCLIELVEVVYSEPTPPVVSRKSRSAVKKNRIMKLYIVNDMIGQLHGHVILTM